MRPGILPLAALLSWFLIPAPAGAQLPPDTPEKPELEWCLDHLPNRHDYPDTGKPFGPTVDFMQELAQRAGFRLRFSPNTPFSRCLRQMEQGKTDLMIRLNDSPDRRRYMHLIPFDRARTEVLLIRQDRPDVRYFHQLAELNLIVVRGYNYNHRALKQLAQQPRSIPIDSQDAGLQMLLMGRGDALISTFEVARNRIQSNPDYHGQFKVASLDLEPDEARFVHLALAKASPYAHLRQQLAEAIETMIADGLIPHYFHHLPQTVASDH